MSTPEGQSVQAAAPVMESQEPNPATMESSAQNPTPTRRHAPDTSERSVDVPLALFGPGASTFAQAMGYEIDPRRGTARVPETKLPEWMGGGSFNAGGMATGAADTLTLGMAPDVMELAEQTVITPLGGRAGAGSATREAIREADMVAPGSFLAGQFAGSVAQGMATGAGGAASRASAAALARGATQQAARRAAARSGALRSGIENAYVSGMDAIGHSGSTDPMDRLASGGVGGIIGGAFSLGASTPSLGAAGSDAVADAARFPADKARIKAGGLDPNDFEFDADLISDAAEDVRRIGGGGIHSARTYGVRGRAMRDDAGRRMGEVKDELEGMRVRSETDRADAYRQREVDEEIDRQVAAASSLEGMPPLLPRGRDVITTPAPDQSPRPLLPEGEEPFPLERVRRRAGEPLVTEAPSPDAPARPLDRAQYEMLEDRRLTDEEWAAINQRDLEPGDRTDLVPDDDWGDDPYYNVQRSESIEGNENLSSAQSPRARRLRPKPPTPERLLPGSPYSLDDDITRSIDLADLPTNPNIRLAPDTDIRPLPDADRLRMNRMHVGDTDYLTLPERRAQVAELNQVRGPGEDTALLSASQRRRMHREMDVRQPLPPPPPPDPTTPGLRAPIHTGELTNPETPLRPMRDTAAMDVGALERTAPDIQGPYRDAAPPAQPPAPSGGGGALTVRPPGPPQPNAEGVVIPPQPTPTPSFGVPPQRPPLPTGQLAGTVDVRPFQALGENLAKELAATGSIGQGPARQLIDQVRSMNQYAETGMPFEAAHSLRQLLDDKNINNYGVSNPVTKQKLLRLRQILSESMQRTAAEHGLGDKWAQSNRDFAITAEGPTRVENMAEGTNGPPSHMGFAGQAAVGMAGLSSGEPVLQAASAGLLAVTAVNAAQGYLRSYGPSIKATALEKVAKHMASNPEALGPLLQPLTRALQRGPAHFAAMVYANHRDERIRGITSGTTVPDPAEENEREMRR